MRLVALVAVALVLTSGCAGSSCDELPALQAQRDAARQAQVELVRSGASSDVIGEADDQLHELERQVYDLEQRCR